MTPRLVVAAPSSGAGKTTVATGLMAAFAARGLKVSPHKVGPDYIDPGYHALATGRPGRNLDPFLVGEEAVVPLFRHGAADADVAVVEGVMGLYDGVSGEGDFASTAHVSRLLDAPVVLVVDASAAGRSVAATVHGFRTFGDVRIGGVILNRIGSDGHEHLCRTAIEELSLPVLGVLRRRDDVATPSRHLGLIPAAERSAAAVTTVERLGALITEGCDLDALLALARTAPALTASPWDPAAVPNASPGGEVGAQRGSVASPGGGRGVGVPPRGGVGHGLDASPGADDGRVAERGGSFGSAGGRPVVAVAGGAAFTFGYAENVELLEAAGAEVVRFDPLRDEGLPEGTRGLVIGGGFPEMYAAELSANEPLRERIRDLVVSGAPVYAECAGLLYLVRELDGAPMCGVLDATATMTSRLTLGYRSAVAVADSVVARTGERLNGHEFHRTAVEAADGGTAAWQWAVKPKGSRREGFVRGRCLASYLHLHWAGAPAAAGRLVEAMASRGGVQ
ncbi:cobyrinate a,c-diamide synthase [Thermomonospora umbrina]|uniref:Hydrogenobyrinate a,c-diamide synthase n=1 Tax=Thermomonospora umbrina TaxID=111806 RepID=A0A3D9SIH4_9ACTN|nr:cobyrinate a,c-diamide synthase [Thermomonospora umbrina]REE95728.1 hydrogenobyrinic acid a,c-diamide synthase (glutamine-hydrolysing) /cobyrinate a,c-diamide synthase [Thermomonospora umbrina]